MIIDALVIEGDTSKHIKLLHNDITRDMKAALHTQMSNKGFSSEFIEESLYKINKSTTNEEIKELLEQAIEKAMFTRESRFSIDTESLVADILNNLKKDSTKAEMFRQVHLSINAYVRELQQEVVRIRNTNLPCPVKQQDWDIYAWISDRETRGYCLETSVLIRLDKQIFKECVLQIKKGVAPRLFEGVMTFYYSPDGKFQSLRCKSYKHLPHPHDTTPSNRHGGSMCMGTWRPRVIPTPLNIIRPELMELRQELIRFLEVAYPESLGNYDLKDYYSTADLWEAV